MAPLLIRPPEAAQALGLSKAKLYQLLAKGELASVKIDGARRIPAEDLRSFVDRLRQEHNACCGKAEEAIDGA